MIEVRKSYEDAPNVPEIFIDTVRLVVVSDGVMRVEFCATRFDGLSATEVTGKMRPAVRVAMTLPAVVDLQAQLTQHLTELEKQGVVKRPTASTTTSTPTH